MLYSVIILSLALPICTIAAFVIGYNMNARSDKKIFAKPKENLSKKSDEETLRFIDDFHA